MADETLEFKPVFGTDMTSEASIGARMDADVNQGVPENDERWVDPRVGSMFYIVKAVIVQELGRVWDALAVEVPSAAFPTRAWGDYLDEWISAFGKERKAAVKSTGEVLFTGEEGALIPAGTRLSAIQTDPNLSPPEFVTTDSGGAISETLEEPKELAGSLEETGALTKELDYYYVVTAINDYGETLASTEKKLTTTATKKQVSLTWKAVTGATGYRVYRSTATGTASKRLIAETINPAYKDAGAAMTETKLPEANNTGGKYRAPIEARDPGLAGNVGVGAIVNILDALEGVETVTNEEPTLNGADEEDDDELLKRLLLEFQGGGAGNQTDYERWSLEVPSVGIVTVIPIADGPGTVKVIIAGPTGDPVSEDVVDDLQEALDPLPGQGAGIAPIDHTVTVVTPEQVEILVDALIDFEDGFSLDGESGTVELRGTIQAALSNYIDMLKSGEDVVYDRVKAAIYSVEGVHKVTTLEVNGGTADIVISSSPAQTARLATPNLTE